MSGPRRGRDGFLKAVRTTTKARKPGEREVWPGRNLMYATGAGQNSVTGFVWSAGST